MVNIVLPDSMCQIAKVQICQMVKVHMCQMVKKQILCVQDAKDMVKKAEYNSETKTAETKVVTNAARAKRNELNDLERILAR